MPEPAVEFVGAGADTGVDDRAAGAAVLGAHVVGDDAELGDGVGRGLDDLVGEALVGGAEVVVVEAVEEEIVRGAAEAIDAEGGFALRGADAGAGGPHDAGGEVDEFGVGAAVEGEFANLSGGDGLAAFGAVGFKERGFGEDLHGGLDGCEFEGEVDPLADADAEIELLASLFAEAGAFYFNQVAADGLTGELEAAGLVGFGSEVDPAAHLFHSDDGAGHRGLGGVPDDADNGAGVELGRQGQSGQSEEEQADG
jgi:hypothetical protein